MTVVFAAPTASPARPGAAQQARRGCLECEHPIASQPSCCLALSAGFIGPRFALLLWWLFGTKVDAAFSTFIWPLLGLLFLPWTTIAYVLAWGPVYGVSGFWGWLLVAIGLFADIATYSSKSAQARYAS